MEQRDRIFKLLQKLNRKPLKEDLHSFRAKIKNGIVFVECRGYEIYIESFEYDKNGKETRKTWAGVPIASANRLYELGLDLESIEI